MIRDLTPHELVFADRDILADRLEKLQAERAQMDEDLQAARARIAHLELLLAQERGQA